MPDGASSRPRSVLDGPFLDAEKNRPQVHPAPGLRPHRDRAGMRIRLLRSAGAQGAARGGVSHHPAQLQPGDDHDRRRVGRPHVYRAHHRGSGRAHPGVERPDAVLPTLGGQTALNLAVRLAKEGVLARYGTQLIGAQLDAIEKAEDRQRFKDTMTAIGVDVPKSGVARSLDDVVRFGAELGFPLILRPSFTLGGLGGGIAYNRDELQDIGARALSYSPVHEVLIEESVLGWKEFELEVMRDNKDNVVIICSIENVDPMGVHTGDSITVAPQQTLSDVEYQHMRDLARKVIRAIGVETGGSNIQFGVNPRDGRIVVIEMNPRVSRSSALASKATGFPIARIAAKLAVGYTLDELPNDITKQTVACFEPSIDYVVVKIPRWTFEKFPDADETLTTQMKSVGEAMAIGRTFKEALQKGIRSMEVKRFGFGLDRYDKWLNAQRATPGESPAAPPRDARDADDKTTQGESLDHEWPIAE